VEELAQQHAQFQALFQATMAEVSSRIASLERQTPDPTSPSPSSVQLPPNNSTPPSLKLDVPIFDGTDPHDWIFKVLQFFEYHRTPEEDRITVAPFYLDGPTLSW
jgi:hypothetical protein